MSLTVPKAGIQVFPDGPETGPPSRIQCGCEIWPANHCREKLSNDDQTRSSRWGPRASCVPHRNSAEVSNRGIAWLCGSAIVPPDGTSADANVPGRESQAASLPLLKKLIFWVQEVWFISCNGIGMLLFKCSSHTLLSRISVLTDRICSWGRAVLVLLMIQHLPAGDLLVRSQPQPESVAFSRYLVSLQQQDPFNEAGPVALSTLR